MHSRAASEEAEASVAVAAAVYAAVHTGGAVFDAEAGEEKPAAVFAAALPAALTACSRGDSVQTHTALRNDAAACSPPAAS